MASAYTRDGMFILDQKGRILADFSNQDAEDYAPQRDRERALKTLLFLLNVRQAQEATHAHQ